MHSLKYTSTRHFALSGFSSFALYELSDRWIFHGLRPKITYKKKKLSVFPVTPRCQDTSLWATNKTRRDASMFVSPTVRNSSANKWLLLSAGVFVCA